MTYREKLSIAIEVLIYEAEHSHDGLDQGIPKAAHAAATEYENKLRDIAEQLEKHPAFR